MTVLSFFYSNIAFSIYFFAFVTINFVNLYVFSDGLLIINTDRRCFISFLC